MQCKTCFCFRWLLQELQNDLHKGRLITWSTIRVLCRWHETTSITIGHFNWQNHCIDSYLLYVAKLAILTSLPVCRSSGDATETILGASNLKRHSCRSFHLIRYYKFTYLVWYKLNNWIIAVLPPAYTLYCINTAYIMSTENTHSLLIIVLAMCYVHTYSVVVAVFLQRSLSTYIHCSDF